MEKKITEKQLQFCRLHSLLGNAPEAAVKAGYPHASSHQVAAKLLYDPALNEKRMGLQDHRLPDAARRGLERLAFGSVNDAFLLLTEEEAWLPSRIASLDLFSVSEVKRPKGGGLEIKFHDRLGALKALAELGGAGRECGPALLQKALEESARQIRDRGPDEN